MISSPPASASDAAAKSTSSPLDLVSGNYTLSIQGVANATGTYLFRLLDLTNAATVTPEVPPPASTPAALTVGGQLNGQPTPLDPQPPLLAQRASASSTVVAPQSLDAVGAAALQQIVFQPNQGQANSPVAFTAKDGDYTLYVMKDGGAVQLVTGNDVLQVNPIGANPNPTIVGLDQQPALLDSSDADLANSIMGVPAYGRIQMTDVYAGIDLTFHANAGAIEYDWTVNPGADASKIALSFTGATRLELDPQGELVVHTSHGEVTEQAPHLYQDIDGVRHDVAGSFALDGAGIVSLQFGEYDHTRPLVIDPVLGYSTYLGSGGNEVVNSTAVDPKTGDTYVMGTLYPYTQSTAGQPGGDPTAAFLSKYNAQGELIWSDTLGNPFNQFQFGIAGDYITHNSLGGGVAFGPDGSVYATYQTYENFWQVTGPPTEDSSNFYGWHLGDTANLVKISSDGTILSDTAFSDTHKGEEHPTSDYLVVGNALAVDSAGATYVPLNFLSPALFAGDRTVNLNEIVKLNADGTRAFTAQVPVFPSAIAVDAQGDFFIAGDSAQDGLFTSPAAFQTHHPAPSGNFNPYIAEYDPSGGGVIAATYLGSPQGGTNGSRVETVSAIALSPVDPNLLYVVGSTTSPSFPVQSYLKAPQLQPFQSKLNLGVLSSASDSDAFVAALDTRDMNLVSSTYLGGSGVDAATSVAVDTAGNVYVAGDTAPHVILDSLDSRQLGPSDFPVVDPLMPTYTNGYALAEFCWRALEHQVYAWRYCVRHFHFQVRFKPREPRILDLSGRKWTRHESADRA